MSQLGGGETKVSAGETKVSAGETKVSASDPAPDTPAPTAADSLTGDILSGASDTADVVDAATAAASAAAASAAASVTAASTGETAVANFWNPLGWILGAAALGSGIYSAVEAGIAGGEADAAGKEAAKAGNPKLPGTPQFAGHYIIPVRNTLLSN
jgi:hypothetical protein